MTDETKDKVYEAAEKIGRILVGTILVALGFALVAALIYFFAREGALSSVSGDATP